MNWTTSREFRQDAEYLWHCWWLPDRHLSLGYSKGVSALLGWKEDYRKRRFAYWNAAGLGRITYSGGFRADPDVFDILENEGTVWIEDRADALQNWVLLLQQNMERRHLVPYYCREEWIRKIGWHWQQIHIKGLASCRTEADALWEAAGHLSPLQEVA